MPLEVWLSIAVGAVLIASFRAFHKIRCERDEARRRCGELAREVVRQEPYSALEFVTRMVRRPLYRLLDEHYDRFERVYDERYQKRYGFWRPVIGRTVDLAAGRRCLCPSCHQKRALLNHLPLRSRWPSSGTQ